MLAVEAYQAHFPPGPHKEKSNLDCIHRSLDVVIRRDTLLDFKDNLSGLVGALCFEVIALGLCGFEYHNLHRVRMTNIEAGVNLTLKLVGCLLVTLQPTTLLKWTVVVLPCPSNIVFPVDAGIICRYSPSIANTLSFIPTNLMGCFRHTVYFL